MKVIILKKIIKGNVGFRVILTFSSKSTKLSTKHVWHIWHFGMVKGHLDNIIHEINGGQKIGISSLGEILRKILNELFIYNNYYNQVIPFQD